MSLRPSTGSFAACSGLMKCAVPMIFPGSVTGPWVSTAVRDAEVGHERAARARLEQDVVRLDVPVHDAAAVRVRQRPGDLAHHAHRVGRRQRAPCAQPLAERLPLDVAHDEEDEPARLADAVDGDDVRVREAGGGARFAHEAFARLGGPRQVGGEHLDGHVAVELDVAGEVDDPHPAAAELPLKRVLSGEGRLEVEEFGGGLRHACSTSEAKGRFVAVPKAGRKTNSPATHVAGLLEL